MQSFKKENKVERKSLLINQSFKSEYELFFIMFVPWKQVMLKTIFSNMISVSMQHNFNIIYNI